MLVRRGVVLLAVVTGWWSALGAQIVLEPLPVVPARAWHQMVGTGSSVLMTGGGNGSSLPPFDDVWLLAGGAWVRIGTMPYAGTLGDAAFDRARQIFVGVDEHAGLGVSLVEWNGVGVTSPINPPAAFASTVQHAIVFDPMRNACVLRGLDLATDTNQLWSYDGVNWQPLSIGAAGPSLGEFRLVTEPNGGLLLVGGGWSSANVETWEWQQGAWSLRPSPPCAVTRFATTNDTATGAPLLAGATISGVVMSMWEWNGAAWLPIGSGGPDLGSGFRMAHDGFGAVVFGGIHQGTSNVVHGDTWYFANGAFQQIGFEPPGVLEPVVACFDDTAERSPFVGRSGAMLETWEWNGARFVLLDSTPSPAGFDVAFDRGRAVAVQHRSDGSTWEWNGSAWSNTVPPGVGPVRDGAALAYDGQRIVLFGGHDTAHAPATNEVWAYDGVTWTRLVTSVSPPTGLERPRLLEDRRRGVVVLVADLTGSIQEWNGTTWTGPLAAPALASLRGTFVGWHPARARVVIGGGEAFAAGGFAPSATLREWDGTSLTPLAATATARVRGAFVAMPDGDAMLLGGVDGSGAPVVEIAAMRSLHPARVVPLGPGCVGTGGVPRLGADPWFWPWSDDVLQMQCTNLGANATAALWVIGLSSTQDAFGPLPRDLAWAGAVGCWQQVAADLAWVQPASQGTSTWSAFVPSGLVGLSLYLQVLSLDPLANPGGFVLSDAVTATIGMR